MNIERNYLNFKETIEVLCDFFEIATHHILYSRQVYPAQLFTLTRKYDIPVHQSRHPSLNSYISDAINAIKPDIERRQVERICVVISEGGMTRGVGNILEKFVFEMESFAVGEDDQVMGSLPLHDLYHHFRGMLAKISVGEALLNPTPPEKSFCIVMELIQGGEPTQRQSNVAWIPSEPSNMQKMTIAPMKTLDTGLIKVQFYVEDSQLKLK